jgi:hypothetical protein
MPSVIIFLVQVSLYFYRQLRYIEYLDVKIPVYLLGSDLIKMRTYIHILQPHWLFGSVVQEKN